MAAGILPIAPIAGLAAAAPVIAPATASTSASPFGALFADAISQVEHFQREAADVSSRFLNGEGDELHRVTLAGQQAQLSFELFLQARNKVISAYQEIMRMQI